MARRHRRHHRKGGRNRVLDYLVYLFARAVVALVQMLSLEQSYRAARLGAKILYRVDKRHVKVGLDNLREAFGDQFTEEERDGMVRAVYLHFCMMFVEILHIPHKLHVTNWRDRIDRKSTRLNSSHRR